jgi:hypothetical protein
MGPTKRVWLPHPVLALSKPGPLLPRDHLSPLAAFSSSSEVQRYTKAASQANAAGLPQCSIHGLRKACGRRLAMGQ